MVEDFYYREAGVIARGDDTEIGRLPFVVCLGTNVPRNGASHDVLATQLTTHFTLLSSAMANLLFGQKQQFPISTEWSGYRWSFGANHD